MKPNEGSAKFGPDFYRAKFGVPRYDLLVIMWLFGICINFFFGFLTALVGMMLYGYIAATIENQGGRS
jgi:hypothetical protein